MLKRRRTVEGSCWPCKQRRVKCDLQKPTCHRCLLLETEGCSYDKVLLRWKKQPAKSVPHISFHLPMEQVLTGISLTLDERRVISYFEGRLWPLFSTVHRPCSPPIALALRSQPVLQALCVFAEEHGALQGKEVSKQTLASRRLRCFTAIRGQLNGEHGEDTSLPELLVAVLLLYFLEGYVNCTNIGASTRCHLAGALAIINALGGFEAVWAPSDSMTKMLLSELASTDLTDALLHDRRPSFPTTVWEHMEGGFAWWDTLAGTKSLGSVFCTIAEMSFYRLELRDGADASSKRTQAFERALQPTFSILDYPVEAGSGNDSDQDLLHCVALSSLFLVRAFQHAGLIYLYSAIHDIPSKHFLIQQHVHACLECVRSMDNRTRAQNCALFPLYIAGAHALDEAHRALVLETLDNIHGNLRFESVLCIREILERLWLPCRNLGTWTEKFKDTAMCTLVI